MLAFAMLPMTALGDSESNSLEPDYEPGIVAPALISRVAPLYPNEARRDSIRGVVLVKARVGRDGRVRSAEVVSSIPALDEQALIAVRRYQFGSPRQNGHECETWALVPVWFGDFLPIGGHLQQPIPVEPDDQVGRAFWNDVATIQQGTAGLPGAEDSEVHERVMGNSLALDAIPPPGDEALEAYARGEAAGRRGNTEGRKQAREQWAKAAQLAPWWPAPYLRLAAASIADRNYEAAERCSRIVLTSRPNDIEANALLRRAIQGRLGDASVHLKQK